MVVSANRTFRYSPLFLNGIVFVCGFAVMIVELLGTRVIAPFYGASLYVWSALISVTLVSLSIGYYFGGRLADRMAGNLLPASIAVAGVFVLIVPVLSGWILPLTDVFGIRLGSFMSAMVLFFPCLTLLGTICPQVIKLDARDFNVIGSSSGRIYSISTVGSLAGTLAVGFVLFPNFGSREIFIGLGLVLAVLGLFLQLISRPRYTSPFVVVIAVFGLLLGADLGTGPNTDAHGYHRVSSEETLYGWVRVLENPERDIRVLASDASIIGASTLSTGKSLLNYQRLVTLLPEFVPNIHRVLLVGQGAGHMAMKLKADYGITTDAIELDPSVNEAAETYFGYRPSGKSVVADGRSELRKMQGPYDLVIHDCFTGGTDPSHLLTVETFRLMRSLMTANGVLALNTVSFYNDGSDPALSAIVKTVDAVFPFHKVYAGDVGHDFNDYVVIASAASLDQYDEHMSEKTRKWFSDRFVTVHYETAKELTDNFNPLESLQLAKSEKYRELVEGWLGSEQMVP